jgi:hypothetical protein
MQKPYLSIIAASRNDNHGGDMTRRMNLFINGLIHQCNKYKLPVELIMVEWNPPEDKPLLKEVLPKPKTGDMLSLRYIVVPKEVHNKYFHAPNIPLFQMTAKNVGIRRASADYILCTNIDLLFNDELMAELAKRNLEKGKFYRANRCDVPADISDAISVEAQLLWCHENIIRRHGFTKGNQNLVGFPSWVYYSHTFSLILNSIAGVFRRWIDPFFSMSTTDYMACGDFTLMSKVDWLDILGYVELDLYSIHIDSMALYACLANGMQQHLYPKSMCTYHIDHADGWATMNPLEVLSFFQKRPGIDWSLQHAAGKYIIEHKTNYGINKPDWGFANENFKEYGFNIPV